MKREGEVDGAPEAMGITVPAVRVAGVLPRVVA
jgi:hypothetical protein